MSSGRRDILFFGSIAVSVIGHTVHHEAVAAQLERQNAFITLRTTASAASVKAEETFGLVSTSPLYEIRSCTSIAAPTTSHTPPCGASPACERWQQAAFLPVMLELAQDAAAEEMSSAEEAEESALLPLDVLDRAEEAEARYTAASVRMEVDMSSTGGHTGPVGTKEVLLPSLNSLARRDLCTLVRLPVSSGVVQRTVGMAEVAHQTEEMGNCGAAEVALSIYVMVRVVSLAEKARLVLEADESVRPLMELPDPVPKMHLDLTQKGRTPYGAMPPTELYRHYRYFFGCYGNTILKSNNAVLQCLTEAPCQREAEMSFPYRWNVLTTVDLRPTLLGENIFAPLAAALSHCANLRTLHVDGNHLGDLSCARLSFLFRRHRYLAHISLDSNAIHEAGGEQLLRLVRCNRRITSVSCNGNYFSTSLHRRIEEAARKNAAVVADDPLNIFSANYDYLVDLSSLPESMQQQGLRTWAMLSAAPLGDVDVMVRNATTDNTHRTLGDSPAIAAQRSKAALRARSSFSLIPPAALAPLLNEVMRSVSVGVARVVSDPLVRSFFSDMETVMAQTRTEKEDLALGEASGTPPDRSLPSEIQEALGGAHPTTIDVEQRYANSFLRILVSALRGISLGTPWAEIAKVLQRIGSVHRDGGVMPEDYWLAVHLLMDAVRISCGADNYDTDLASSFLALVALAVRTAVGLNTETLK